MKIWTSKLYHFVMSKEPEIKKTPDLNYSNYKANFPDWQEFPTFFDKTYYCKIQIY